MPGRFWFHLLSGKMVNPNPPLMEKGVLGGDGGGRIQTMQLGCIDPEASSVILPATPPSGGGSVSQYQFGWDPPQDSRDSEIQFG